MTRKRRRLEMKEIPFIRIKLGDFKMYELTSSNKSIEHVCSGLPSIAKQSPANLKLEDLKLT
jgi:hypothetical protein